jgi:replicative DNA helicase
MTAAPQIVPLPHTTPAPTNGDTALRAEQALISRLLNMGPKGSAAFAQVSDLLPSYFSTEAHSLIWHGFKALAAENIGFCAITLQSRLDRPLAKSSTTALDKVGAAYIDELEAQRSVSSLADTARIVREWGVMRKGVETAQAIVRDMQSLPPQHALDSALKRLQDHSTHVLGLDGNAGQTLGAGVKQSITEIQGRQKAYLSGDTTGLFMSTGYRAMDEALGGGLFRRENTVIMADSNVGKSALSFNIALNAMLANLRVIFIPLEMAIDKMNARALSVLGDVPSHAIRTGKIGDDQLERLIEVSQRLERAESAQQFYYLAFDPLPNINTINAKLNQYTSLHGVDLIVIDQISQEALSPVKMGTPLPEWIAHAAGVARGWAKTCNAHVITVTQASKAHHQRADGKIQLFDGASSTGPAKSAENVISLAPLNPEDTSAIQRIECQVLKQRDGRKNITFNLDLIGYLTKFVNEGDHRE